MIMQITSSASGSASAARQPPPSADSDRRAGAGAGWQDGQVDVLSSRIIVRPADPDRSRRFYRDLLGLAVCREFGSPADPGMVFFLGAGLLPPVARSRSSGSMGAVKKQQGHVCT
jgi:hypothetical protein